MKILVSSEMMLNVVTGSNNYHMLEGTNVRNIPLNYWSPFVEGKESRETPTLGVWQGGRNLPNA